MSYPAISAGVGICQTGTKTVGDYFDGVEFALGVGRFRITGTAGQAVRLHVIRPGADLVFEVSPEQAEKIADALKVIAACVMYSDGGENATGL